MYANLCSLHILASIRISLNAKEALLAILSNVCFYNVANSESSE